MSVELESHVTYSRKVVKEAQEVEDNIDPSKTRIQDTLALSKAEILSVLKEASNEETQEFRMTENGENLVSAHNYSPNEEALMSLSIPNLENILNQTHNKQDKKLLKRIIKEKRKQL